MRETKIEKQILKLSVTAGSGTPLAFFPGGNQSPISFWKGSPLEDAMGRVKVTAWHHLLRFETSRGCSSVCCWTESSWCVFNVLKSGCQTELLRGSAEEGLDNLVNLVSAEPLITVQRLELITTGNLSSSSHPQG